MPFQIPYKDQTKIAIALLVLASSGAWAEGREQIMFSRYLRYQICMEKSFGQGFHNKLGLPTVMNRWGVSEARAVDVNRMSDKFKHADLNCRKKNDIEGEPRPK